MHQVVNVHKPALGARSVRHKARPRGLGGAQSKVALTLEGNVGPCLVCSAVPPAHQPRLRTTNGSERLNQERNGRTRVVRVFPNSASCLCLVTPLCTERSEEWLGGRRYLNMAALGPSPAMTSAS
jgi:putative transposase